MAIQTDQYAVKALFEQKQTFTVPKYQRSYAWDEDSVHDFIDDISKCLEARENDDTKHHFFGGVVTVRKDVPGSTRDNYEVIDGQQRLASFVMLVASLIRKMEHLLGELDQADSEPSETDVKAKQYLQETVGYLRNLFVIFRDNKGIEYVDVPKLTLSKADHQFFIDTISGHDAEAKRESHFRIEYAWKRLNKYVNDELFNDKESTWDKATQIQQLIDNVLGRDCTVVFMCSDTRTEAYQIFQVLNNRGVQLGNGDLLRASTLELLDDPKFNALQEEVAGHWDDILKYAPRVIDDFLLWYFSSVTGWRPKPAELADQFLEYRFKCKNKTSVTKKGAELILKEVKALEKNFATLQTMKDGDWPYADYSSVKSWDRERLTLLVSHLDHTNAMPLLLALSTLDAKKFAEAVAALERFVFRYKTIGNAHIGPATKLYLDHSIKIRTSSKYAMKGLRDDLNELIDKYVPDSVFGPAIEEKKFAPRAGNADIRYFLVTVEDYTKWYESGAQGVPKCKDKSRIFDISSTTVEHIYPQKVSAADKDNALESYKHNIGNLTVAAPGENDKLANKSFSKKRPVLQASSLKMNRDIGAHTNWTTQNVTARAQELSSIALKIFRA